MTCQVALDQSMACPGSMLAFLQAATLLMSSGSEPVDTTYVVSAMVRSPCSVSEAAQSGKLKRPLSL